jgi:hypothetical protein
VQLDDPLAVISAPVRVWSRGEVLSRPSPVPARSGVYAWYFREIPHPEINVRRCVQHGDLTLLYVGIAPKPPPVTGRALSRATLRSRIRQHYSLNAAGSTLRLSLGCLLSERLGIELRRVGSGHRLTFTREGEERLSAWMAENAYVAWSEAAEPWVLEDEALARLDLPLNLRGNIQHPFHAMLTAIRASAKARARHLPVA